MDNVWKLPPGAGAAAEELVDVIVDSAEVRVERIVSCGHTTPPGQWYDQDRDEWVVLLQGKATLEYEDGIERTLGAGDHLLIPARVRHRVHATSTGPCCIWIAVHGGLTTAARPELPSELGDGSIALRKLAPAHAEALSGLVRRSIAELRPWMPWSEASQEVEVVRQWIEGRERAWRGGSAFELVIVDAESGVLLGAAGINGIGYHEGIANLGYWVGTEHQGRGLATAAARLLARAAFDHLPLHRLEVHVAKGNTSSARVAEKLGAVREGLLRQGTTLGDGSHADAWLYSLLRDDLCDPERTHYSHDEGPNGAKSSTF